MDFGMGLISLGLLGLLSQGLCISPERNVLASQKTAVLKSKLFKWIARSMAPPPPIPLFQLINLVPETEITPCEVCHLCLSNLSFDLSKN